MRHRRSIIIALLAVVVVGVALLVVRACQAAHQRAQASSCAGRMFPFTFAAFQWMQDNKSSRFPTNLAYLSSEGAPVRWLVCPRDTSRTAAADWASFTPEHSSYEIVSPGMAEHDTNSVFLRCRIHAHLAYGDMTVFDGVRRRHKFE